MVTKVLVTIGAMGISDFDIVSDFDIRISDFPPG